MSVERVIPRGGTYFWKYSNLSGCALNEEQHLLENLSSNENVE